VLHLGEALTRPKTLFEKASKSFQNDPALLGQEGELSNVLAQAKRAEQAFEKAFASNPKSTLLARRLSRIQRAKGAFDDALFTLRKTLEANPSKRELHYDIAMVLLESDPVARSEVWGRAAVSFQARIYSGGQELFSAVLLCAAIVFARTI